MLKKVREYLKPRLLGEITIQQRSENYVVVAQALCSEDVLRCFETLAELHGADIVFSADGLCHVFGDTSYHWPTRKISKPLRGAIQSIVKNSEISKDSLDLAARCIECICMFESVRFIPAVTLTETLSWTDVCVKMRDVHVVDLQYLRTTLDDALIDVKFEKGELRLKLRHIFRGKRGKPEKNGTKAHELPGGAALLIQDQKSKIQ